MTLKESESEVTVSMAAQNGERKFLFRSSLPLTAQMGECLNLTLSRLKSMGRRDFSDERLAGPATHLLSKPGKLLRPALVFAGAQVVGEDMTRFVDLAVACELLHTASLVHDDVIDEDTVRRGLPSVHVKYGKETAILAGDALIGKAVQLASKYGADVMEAMARASIDVCAGELIDYSYQKRRVLPDLKTYMRIADLKTASLIGNAFCTVAVYKKSKAAERMLELGKRLGAAFQIRDDIIEAIDAEEMRRNGQPASAKGFRLSVVEILKTRSPDAGRDAIEKAVVLNNDLLDKASAAARALETNADLERYIDFVRVRTA